MTNAPETNRAAHTPAAARRRDSKVKGIMRIQRVYSKVTKPENIAAPSLASALPARDTKQHISGPALGTHRPSIITSFLTSCCGHSVRAHGRKGLAGTMT